jgi:hypothetical protein
VLIRETYPNSIYPEVKNTQWLMFVVQRYIGK